MIQDFSSIQPEYYATMRNRYLRSLLGQFRFGEMVPYIEWPGAQVRIRYDRAKRDR